MAADVLGRHPDPSEQGLVARAEGNPLYVVEILRDADRRKPPDAPGGTREMRIARTLASAVLDHLRTLSEDARRLIEVASVLGPAFSVVELAAVTGRPASDLVEPLDEAIAADVLLDAGSELAFRHDRFPQAVYDEIAESLRLALHRDAASALAAQGAPVLRVPNHLAIGALPGRSRRRRHAR